MAHSSVKYDNALTQKTDEYLRKHRIQELFEDLCTAICYKRPDNIQAFLREQLKLKKLNGFKTGLFSKDEIANIFTLFDLKKDGSIGRETCKQALQTLAASEFQWTEIDEANVPDKIDLKMFQALCDEYFFGFKPENHKRRTSGKKIGIDEVDRACLDLFKEYDRDLNSKLNSSQLKDFCQRILSDGGYPSIQSDSEILEQAIIELALNESDKITLKDFKTYVGYVLKQIQ